ncbi:MAG: hypothetical protein V4682_00445 [Patescibacteria group bacterium]
MTTHSTRHHGKAKVALVNLAVTGVVLVGMYFLFPSILQDLVFDLGIRKGWYVLPWLIVGAVALSYYRNHPGIGPHNVAEHRRPLAVLVTLVVLAAIANIGVFATFDLMAYRLEVGRFAPRQGLIPASVEATRFTPRANACTDMSNSVSATGEHVDCKYVQPMITDHGFGYVAPITPSGIINTFLSKNPGFLRLDDAASVNGDPTRRLVRIDERQEVGQGMHWFDDVKYVLARTDFFASYDTPHFLALDPTTPDVLTLVVPKIKYRYFRFPYWGGVVLIHSDGRVENLSADEAMKDPRLAGKWIYPLSLARRYVKLQNYAAGHGIMTPFVRLVGKFQIEDIPGNNEFPLLTRGADGRTYLVTATKGEGSAKGLFRMYFTDATTGRTTYHQFGSHEVVYGVGASLDRITNIPGYQWRHGDTGVMEAIEPVYIVRQHDPTLYWKFTITNLDHSGISATAVANASRPDDVRVFTRRADFEAWLRGTETGPSGQGAQQQGTPEQAMLATLAGLEAQLKTLREQVTALPGD